MSIPRIDGQLPSVTGVFPSKRVGTLPGVIPAGPSRSSEGEMVDITAEAGILDAALSEFSRPLEAQTVNRVEQNGVDWQYAATPEISGLAALD